MEIVWFGHSCFRLKGKEATVLTDPFSKSLGYPVKKHTANIVTISHDHPHHSFVEGIANEPKVVGRPGEYEISNVFIKGISTYHDANNGELRGKNIAYMIEMEDIKICHLGDLGHIPSPAQSEQMTGTDILLIPVGGVSTINAAQAAEIISLLSPKTVIPMHYKTEAITIDLEPLDRFLKEMGIREVNPQPKLNTAKSSLSAETSITILDYR